MAERVPVRVLVADDDAIVVRLLSAQLRHLGYEPVTVGDGTAALAALLASDGPCLALLDGDMPGYPGVEVCRRARAAGRPLHLVLASANRDSDDVSAALAAGADDFLCKPVELEDLRLRLRLGERLVGLTGGGRAALLVGLADGADAPGRRELADALRASLRAGDRLVVHGGLVLVLPEAAGVAAVERLWARVRPGLAARLAPHVPVGVVDETAGEDDATLVARLAARLGAAG